MAYIDFLPLLTAARSHFPRRSDREVAMHLGLSPSYFSQLKRNNQNFSDRVITGLCELTGNEPQLWIAKAQMLRAPEEMSPHYRSIYEMVAAKVKDHDDRAA